MDTEINSQLYLGFIFKINGSESLTTVSYSGILFYFNVWYLVIRFT